MSDIAVAALLAGTVLLASTGGYDLIVLGHRGHFVRDRLLGSTADRVAEHAHCPVMIVR
jgi:nucleotide-binding universal stress UspA family protein